MDFERPTAGFLFNNPFSAVSTKKCSSGIVDHPKFDCTLADRAFQRLKFENSPKILSL